MSNPETLDWMAEMTTQFKEEAEKAAWYQGNYITGHDPISYQVRWLYVIKGSEPPFLYARVITDISRFHAEIGELHLSGAYVRQVHEDMVSDPSVVLSPVLVTPFKVMVGSDVVFELNDPEWIAKATANVLTDVGTTVTQDAYSKEMLAQEFIMLKSRHGGSVFMQKIQQMQHDDYDLRNRMGVPPGFIMKGQPDKTYPDSIIQTPKVESLKDKIIKHLNIKKK